MDQVKLNTKYRLLCLQTGTYLTRSEDKVSIVGNEYTGEKGQEWVFQSTGDLNHFTIKAADAHGIQYLTVPISCVFAGQQLQCNRIPTVWKVCKVEYMATVVRFTPMLDGNLNVDVNRMSPEDGTEIQLWPYNRKNNQLWVLEEVNK